LNKRVYKLLSLIGFVLISVISTNEAFAKEDNALGYTVSPVQPKTQIDPEKSYFYVKTVPNESQTLEVRVQSTKKEDVHLKIYGVSAYTGNEGTIEYTNDLSTKDETLKVPVTNLIKIDTPDITVGNFEEKTVKIELTPPKESYSGVKMGGIVFALDKGKEEKGVSTEYSYKIGLMMAENGDEINNGENLKLNSVKASMTRGKKMVLATLQNPDAKVLENLNMVATMTKKGSGEVIKEKTVQNYRMAPNSHFDFEMDWGISNLPSGDYTLNINAKNYNKEWNLKKDFTITNEQAKKINEESVFKIITPTWLKVISVVLFVCTIVLVVIQFSRRKKWEKAWKRLRIAKKKKKGKRNRLSKKQEKR